MIACKKCGHENDLGRIFCIQCGDKLDLSSIESPTEGKKFWSKVRHEERKRQGRSGRQIAWRWIKVIVFVFLLLCIALIFYAPDSPKIERSDAMGIEANKKHKAMMEALTKDRRESFVLSQNEINILIPALDAERGGGGFGSYHARARYLEIGDGEITSYIQGDIAFGSSVSLPIVVRLSGNLSASNGSLTFNETGLFIGRLPIPRLLFPAFRYLMNRVENFWDDEQFKDDRAQLGRARSIRAADGKLTIECGPAPASPRP